jgi:hypothetical protein
MGRTLIELTFKDLSGTNGLAYFPATGGSEEEKRYMPVIPVDNVINLFTAISYDISY